jgi:hypothetical protein
MGKLYLSGIGKLFVGDKAIPLQFSVRRSRGLRNPVPDSMTGLAFTPSFKAHLFRNRENRMRHIRRSHFRRRPRRFRFRPRGFSERFTGPIYRGAFKLLGVPPEGRRPAYNALAIVIVGIVAIGFGASSLGSDGIGAGINALVISLVVGGIAVTVFRFFR